MNHNILPIIAFSLILPVAATEQASASSPEEEAVRTSVRADPSLTGDIQEAEPAITLLTTQDGSKISAKLGWPIGKDWDLGIQIEAPFDENNPKTNLANLDGLAGDTVGTFRLTRETIDFVEKRTGMLSDLCREAGITDAADCGYRALSAKSPKWGRRALRVMPVTMRVFSFSYSLSEPSFSFVDPTTLEESKVSETNSSLGITLGWFVKGVYVGAGYKHRETFTAGPRTELCRSLDTTTTALTCSEVQFGPPEESTQDIASFDVKWRFRPSLAVNLRLLYDFEEDLFNPHVLLFFLQEKSGALNGGLDLSYDDEDDFSARLFVGTKFDLFPG